MRRHADGIAPARFADRWHINRRTAMPANDVLPILAITLSATDAASIQRRPVTVRLLNDHEAQRLPTGANREQVHLAVLHFTHRDAHLVPHGINSPRRRW